VNEPGSKYVDGYNIERKKAGEVNYVPIATVQPNATTSGGPNTYIDGDLPSHTKCLYRVKAYNLYGWSAYAEASATAL
jgi:hypothetical protein